MTMTITQRAYGLKEYARKLAKQASERLDSVENRTKSLEAKIKSLEAELSKWQMTAILPDEVDVHNINRRIEILARKIALMESKAK